MKSLIRIFYALFVSFILILMMYLPSHPLFPKKEVRELNVFIWGDFFHPETIPLFEKESGIRVNLNFYSNNEELLAKMRNAKNTSYDLILPSDYATKILIDEKLVKPINLEKCSFMNRIEPYLLNKDFDRQNRYSVPYFWEIFGLAILKNQFSSGYEPTYADLFEHHDYKVVMTPDPSEAFMLATHHLFGMDKMKLSLEEIGQVRQLLQSQKSLVEAYTDYRAKYLVATENCPLAVMKSSFLCQIAKEYPETLSYKIPKGKIYTSIESFMIPASSKHTEEAYILLNFLFRPEILAKQIDVCPLFPACKDALPHATVLMQDYFDMLTEIERRGHFIFFFYLIPADLLREIWVNVKK